LGVILGDFSQTHLATLHATAGSASWKVGLIFCMVLARKERVADKSPVQGDQMFCEKIAQYPPKMTQNEAKPVLQLNLYFYDVIFKNLPIMNNCK
jgi:hypothetical protein